MKSILTMTSVLVVAATAAQAQTTTGATSAKPATAGELSEVVVTGSRVITNGDASPTPVTVVTVEDVLRVQPTTIADALNTLPTFSGSRSQFNNPNNGTSIQTGGGNTAGNNLNLRNLGSVRTLILFDGLRVPPTNVNGVVDVDMIPQMLLQRVDVVTGGASAVYGSDAVTGVVNFITDRRFNGVKANAQYGTTQKNDDISYNAGIAGGMDLFGGKGHIEGSFEYRDDKGVDKRSARDPDHKVWSIQGAGTAASPFFLTPYARVNTSTFGGLVVANASGPAGVLVGQTFNSNGVLTPFVHGASAGTTGGANEIGGDGIYYDTSLKAPLKSKQIFGRFDYDLTDRIHAFTEMAGNDKQNVGTQNWVNLNQVTLSRDNAFLPATYRTQLANANQATFRLSKQMMDAPRIRSLNTERQWFFNGGLEGQFGKGYKWTVDYVHSNATLTQNVSTIDNGKLYAALDAVVNPANGQIVCQVSTTANAGLYPGCVPLNPFGPTSDTPDAVNYFMTTTQFDARTKQDDFSGSLSGAPFSTWAGPVNMALSGEWRKLTYSLVSNSDPTDRLNCTPFRFNCVATSVPRNQSTANRSEVAQTVKEAAIEADMPLLKDVRLVKSFNINGAVRYTKYDTSGNYTTWKAGIDWHLTDELRVRGTRSRDIRAPTLDDLFSPTSANSGAGNFQDLLTNTVATNVTTISGGNPDMKAEQGDTWTGGIVYRPSALPNFSLAVDYYDIRVTNAILALLSTNVTIQRACVNSGGTSPYCQLYVRPFPYSNTTSANVVTTVYNRSINIAEQDTNGVDIEANWATRLFDRPASLRLLAAYQPHIKYIQPTVPTLDQAGAGFGNNGVSAAPDWRLTAFFRFSPIENLNVSLQTRWRTSLRFAGDPTLVFSSPKIPSASFTNLNLSYGLKGPWGQGEVFVVVNNLFDKAAAPASAFTNQAPGQQNGFVLYDDPLGRAFTFGVRTRF